MRRITRRAALQQLGVGVGVGLCAIGCGSSADAIQIGSDPNQPEGGKGPGDNPIPGDKDAGPGPKPDPDAGPGPELTPTELLAGIDAIVVLMMENRSFDHFLGALKSDPTYPGRTVVEGLSGTEWNSAPDGSRVEAFRMDNFTPQDPPHEWSVAHEQWNNGANDGFVKAHAGASQDEVMGFHDRSQIPFYYWLCDNFTVCDNWHSSLLGPTWPNRYYLHATSSNGRKGNVQLSPPPPADTVWDRLKASGKTYKNYYAGAVAWYTGAFVTKLLSMNPTARIDKFFDDAKNGTLPNFSIIDPDFTASDDHPAHNIQRGQAFVASVYKALTESPQWAKTLFVITYDENGGFYDHVAPPVAEDENAEFRQLGFRVPAIVVGPTVRKGYVNKTVLEHSSIAATLGVRFGISSLGPRMDAANHIASCIDPKLVKAPSLPPSGMPVVQMTLNQALEDGVGPNSQPKLDEMIASGEIPPRYVDQRPHRERIAAWTKHAERLGALRLTR